MVILELLQNMLDKQMQERELTLINSRTFFRCQVPWHACHIGTYKDMFLYIYIKRTYLYIKVLFSLLLMYKIINSYIIDVVKC